MRHMLIWSVAAIAIAAAGLAIAADWQIQKENKGAPEMVLYGGKTGNVPFGHLAHQKRETCEACHNLFPQEKGAIEKFKANGQLKKKKAMKQCQKCHRKLKRAGQKSGPTGCKECHSVKG